MLKAVLGILVPSAAFASVTSSVAVGSLISNYDIIFEDTTHPEGTQCSCSPECLLLCLSEPPPPPPRSARAPLPQDSIDMLLSDFLRPK
jgi:hypothetical protein